MANRATNVQLALVDSGELRATWFWVAPAVKDVTVTTDSFSVKWEYLTELSGSTWLLGQDSSVDVSKCTKTSEVNELCWSKYSIPSSAIKVRFTVKPIARDKTSGVFNQKKEKYWTATWSSAVEYVVSDNPPITPPVPTPEIVHEPSTDRYKIQVVLENLNVNADIINFQILKRAGTKVLVAPKDGLEYSTTAIQYPTDADKADRTNGYARYTRYVDDNGEYYVRVRSVRGNLVSDWSEYAGPVYSRPYAPAEILEIRPSSKTSVYIKWSAVETAESYDIQYATDLSYFDISDKPTSVSGVVTTERDIELSEPGKVHWFRVRAVRGDLASEWTSPVSVAAGTKPGMPTTWSSSTSVITGESLVFYWVHNSADGSKETEATLELTIGGSIQEFVIPNERDEDSDTNISFFTYDTSSFVYGTEILWQVKTKGVHDDYGDWSISRTVNVYPITELSLGIIDSNNNFIDKFTAFPMYITATTTPKDGEYAIMSHKPISYYLTIIADEAHETVDNLGNFKMVAKGDVIFTQYYDTSERLEVTLSAGDVTFENNIRYILHCEVTMDSGLSAEASVTFTTAWADDEYFLNAEVGIDTTSYTATIRPYCQDDDGAAVSNVLLSVYRRNYDSTLTEIMRDIANDGTTVTDPHPSLDYARYRIVATNTISGAVSYYDIPGVEVGCNAIVIQWSESWSSYDNPDDTPPSEPSWAGSMLRLQYNIDVQENVNPDVSRVEYIGRKHPVSYFGTHLGESATWSAVIDKNDTETLYGLRRLARWMGNVYVREPSGIGYWATVKVSLGRNHGDMTIPVSLGINRVEGGM